VGSRGQGVKGSREIKNEYRISNKEFRIMKFFPSIFSIDGLVKSPKTVMPDLIRHPEVIGFTGFRLSPE
jgi:hypothetical protein